MEITSNLLRKARRSAARTKAVAACQLCKLKRTKCTGYWPCAQCVSSETACEFEKLRPAKATLSGEEQTASLHEVISSYSESAREALSSDRVHQSSQESTPLMDGCFASSLTCIQELYSTSRNPWFCAHLATSTLPTCTMTQHCSETAALSGAVEVDGSHSKLDKPQTAHCLHLRTPLGMMGRISEENAGFRTFPPNAGPGEPSSEISFDQPADNTLLTWREADPIEPGRRPSGSRSEIPLLEWSSLQSWFHSSPRPNAKSDGPRNENLQHQDIRTDDVMSTWREADPFEPGWRPLARPCHRSAEGRSTSELPEQAAMPLQDWSYGGIPGE